MTYRGTYEIKNNDSINCEVDVEMHSDSSPEARAVFGGTEGHLELSGKFSQKSFKLEGYTDENRNRTITITGTRHADLAPKP